MNIGHCGATNDYLFLEQLVARKKEELNSFYKNNQCLGILVVGLSCNNIFHNEIPLSSEQSIKKSLKSAVATSCFLSMVRPAAHAAPLIRALFEFMKFLNWRKLGIITEIGNTSHAQLKQYTVKQRIQMLALTLSQCHIGKFK